MVEAQSRRCAERIRVLILVDIPSLAGGAERIAVRTAARLNPDRFDTILCSTRWHPGDDQHDIVAPALAELEAAGVETVLLTRRSKADLRPWPKLLRELRRRRIDVLHAHKFGSNVWGAALGRLAGVPVIISHEHSWSYEGGLLRRMLDRQLIARASDAFLAVSREDRRCMVEIEGIDARDVLFVPNGISVQRPTSRDIRSELGIPADAPVLGTVGHLSREKPIDVLVHAAARLTGEFPALHVLVVGDGPTRARVEALLDALGMAGTVRLLGHRDDVPDILASLDVAVLASDREGSPLAVMEYMGAGLPIVATAVGGVPDLISDGVHGQLVEARNPKALADAIADLLRSPQLAQQMGRQACERQREEFGLEGLVSRLEQLYSGLVAARSSGGARRVQARAVLDSLRSEWAERSVAPEDAPPS